MLIGRRRFEYVFHHDFLRQWRKHFRRGRREHQYGFNLFHRQRRFARGIFSTCDSPVSVIAGGDININGSRIAAYDGGNVTVESLHGDVNVGTGGQGSATVEEIYVNPAAHEISAYTVTIPGCGILATTFPKSLDPAFPTSQNTVGDILVETPQGNITSTSAGIVQIPLNSSSASSGSVTLLAGYELRDASGQAVSAAGQSLVEETATSAPGANALARLVVINGDPIQASASVWPRLLALLGLPANESQIINLQVSANPTDFENAVAGDGAGLANYSFLSMVSAAKNIDVTGGGVIGANVQLKATGDIKGSIVARNNLDISALQNVSASTFANGDTTVNAGESVSGTLIGLGDINVNAGSIKADLLSQNIATTGDLTSSQIGFAPITVANVASQSESAEAATTAGAAFAAASGDEPGSGKGRVGKPKLVSSGRVTVLPPKKPYAPNLTSSHARVRRVAVRVRQGHHGRQAHHRRAGHAFIFQLDHHRHQSAPAISRRQTDTAIHRRVTMPPTIRLNCRAQTDSSTACRPFKFIAGRQTKWREC